MADLRPAKSHVAFQEALSEFHLLPDEDFPVAFSKQMSSSSHSAVESQAEQGVPVFPGQLALAELIPPPPGPLESAFPIRMSTTRVAEQNQELRKLHRAGLCVPCRYQYSVPWEIQITFFFFLSFALFHWEISH